MKIELIERNGSGADSKAKLRVILSGINIWPAETLNFETVGINNTVTITNNSATSLSVTTISIGGRNPLSFAIETDGCSGKNLLKGESCAVTLSFSPGSEGNKFGVLVVPTSDHIRPEGTITLYGKGIADTTPPDTSITGGPSGANTTNSATFTFTGTDNVTPTANLLYATYLQGYDAGWSSFNSSISNAYSNLPDGSYTFQVKAKDQAGNEDFTPATRAFVVVNAPGFSISGHVANKSGNPVEAVEVCFRDKYNAEIMPCVFTDGEGFYIRYGFEPYNKQTKKTVYVTPHGPGLKISPKKKAVKITGDVVINFRTKP